MTKRVLCSWCLYDVFTPISKKIVICYNCEKLKCIDEETEEFVRPSVEY